MSEQEDFIKLLGDLDELLLNDIHTYCSYHPAGRNHLFLNPLEREVILKRIAPRIQDWHLHRINELVKNLVKA